MLPLCLLLAVIYQQQQSTIQCSCLVRFVNFPLRLNLLLFVFKEEFIMMDHGIFLTRSSDMIQPVTHGQLQGGWKLQDFHILWCHLLIYLASVDRPSPLARPATWPRRRLRTTNIQSSSTSITTIICFLFKISLFFISFDFYLYKFAWREAKALVNTEN